jgi:hypothetical protein
MARCLAAAANDEHRHDTSAKMIASVETVDGDSMASWSGPLECSRLGFLPAQNTHARTVSYNIPENIETGNPDLARFLQGETMRAGQRCRLGLLFIVASFAPSADTLHEPVAGISRQPLVDLVGARELGSGWGPIVREPRNEIAQLCGPFEGPVSRVRGGGEEDFHVEEDYDIKDVPKVRDAVLKMWEVRPRFLPPSDTGFSP